MSPRYHARWVSKNRSQALKKAGSLRDSVLLDNPSGFILVEPAGKRLADGPTLSAEDAEYELQPAWCLDSPARLAGARRRLGLDPDPQASRRKP
jgi:hypothetical protein